MDTSDQARLPIFRALLVIQGIAAIVFGLVPYVLPTTFASLFGYRGDAALTYRLAGAATMGYGVTVIVAFMQRSTWSELRIPITATFGFNVTAVLASVLSIVGGDRSLLPILVLLAAAAFSVLSAYWLRRDEGPAIPTEPSIGQPFRIVIALATLSAGVFGVLPLLVPDTFVSLFGVPNSDLTVLRLAGAATFGYAVAGILSLQAAGYPAFRVQNVSAVAFNALGSIGSLLAMLSGQGGLLAPVVFVAATFFAVSLTWLARQTSGD